jgi:polysaccharide pyruvyl transferase CsaB
MAVHSWVAAEISSVAFGQMPDTPGPRSAVSHGWFNARRADASGRAVLTIEAAGSIIGNPRNADTTPAVKASTRTSHAMTETNAPTAPSYRVGISGSYGGLNLGDEAILQGIIEGLSRSLPVEITVFTRDAEDTRRRHPTVARVVPVRELARKEILPEIRRLDLLILGGGGILFDEEAQIYLREVELALENNVAVMLYAIGAGPLKTSQVQAHVREILERVDAVTVREAKAHKVLEDIGIGREIVVTADPAFLLQPDQPPRGAFDLGGLRRVRHLVGMSVREPGGAAPDIEQNVYHALLANAADFMVERYDAGVVFVPMEPRMRDAQHAHAVISQMFHAQRATVLTGEYTSAQLLALVGRFDFAIGMRLHFLIFAALQGVPFVALPYASKVEGFLADLDIVMPPIQKVSAGRLIAYIDQYWDRRRKLQKSIQKVLPSLRRRALESNAIAVRLLKAGRALPGEAGATDEAV